MVFGLIQQGVAAIGGILGGGGGLGSVLGGGGAGKIEIDADIDADMRSAMTIGGGDKPLHTKSDNKLEGGAPVKTETKLEGGTPLHTKMEMLLPQPLRTESRNEMAVTQPVVTEMSTHMDMEPVVMDLCVNVGLNKLPQTRIRRPYERHFGVTLGGEELIGFDWSGNSTLFVDNGKAHPHIEGGPAEFGHYSPDKRHAPAHVVSDDATPGFRIVVD